VWASRQQSLPSSTRHPILTAQQARGRLSSRRCSNPESRRFARRRLTRRLHCWSRSVKQPLGKYLTAPMSRRRGSGPTTHYCLSGDLRSFSAPPLPTCEPLERRSQGQAVIVGSAATSHQSGAVRLSSFRACR
jgi:hypothetical protein